MREHVTNIVKELSRFATIQDTARGKLVETWKTITPNWMRTADVLEAQGEIILAGDVRNFALHLPRRGRIGNSSRRNSRAIARVRERQNPPPTSQSAMWTRNTHDNRVQVSM